MAIKLVVMPIAAVMSQYEMMGGDDERFQKRVRWQGETEKTAIVELDAALNEGFKIVDVQQTSANNYQYLRYTLHKSEDTPKETDVDNG